MRLENETAMALLRAGCNVAEVMAATGLHRPQVMAYRRRLLRDLPRKALIDKKPSGWKLAGMSA